MRFFLLPRPTGLTVRPWSAVQTESGVSPFDSLNEPMNVRPRNRRRRRGRIPQPRGGDCSSRFAASVLIDGARILVPSLTLCGRLLLREATSQKRFDRDGVLHPMGNDFAAMTSRLPLDPRLTLPSCVTIFLATLTLRLGSVVHDAFPADSSRAPSRFSNSFMALRMSHDTARSSRFPIASSRRSILDSKRRAMSLSFTLSV